MDIHKPKPWHGWREFLKEYGIIVLGVLTALAAEAVVQNSHDRRVSRDAIEAVRSEINVNLTVHSRRLAWEPCIARRLSEIEALLDGVEAGGSFSPPSNLGGPFQSETYTARWEAARAGGRTSLLSSEEQRAYGRVYTDLSWVREVTADESEAWSHLGALSSLRRLLPADIYDQRLALFRARAADERFRYTLENAKRGARLVGLTGETKLHYAPGEAAEAQQTPLICQPLKSAGGRR